MSQKQAKPASHDTAPPPQLLSFMLSDWKPSKPRPARVHPHAALFAERRRSLMERFSDGILIIPTGAQKVRANDTFYPFRPGTDYFYLTGHNEPDGILLIDGKKKQASLYIDVSPGRVDASFFTDRVKGELWEGPRPSLSWWQQHLGFANCQPLTAWRTPVGKVRLLRGFSSALDQQIPNSQQVSPSADQELAVVLSEMRLVKEELEVKELERVIQATERGFEDVIARLRTARTERELEGVFFTRARMEGQDVGYGSIVASGDHACTLHWKRNDGAIRHGDLLLLDAGIESEYLYTADITRTLPISGRFSRDQQAIYELVLAAQAAGIAAVKSGDDFMAPNRAAMTVLAEGLEELGILKVSASEALDDERQFYKRYSLHNVSHMLGMDVHDCAQARAESYKFGALKPGMVLTVEPGLYFQPDDLTVPSRYRGIGIRIEDDVVVTNKGCHVLSRRIPRAPKDVEKWMKAVWRNRRSKV